MQYNPNDPLAMVFDPRRIAANSGIAQFNATLAGKDPNEALAKQLELQENARKDQIERIKFALLPHVNLFDSIIRSESPAAVMAANPTLMQHWPQVARTIGVDPGNGFNDDNVRRSLIVSVNQLRARYGEPAVEYPVPAQDDSARFRRIDSDGSGYREDHTRRPRAADRQIHRQWKRSGASESSGRDPAPDAL